MRLNDLNTKDTKDTIAFRKNRKSFVPFVKTFVSFVFKDFYLPVTLLAALLFAGCEAQTDTQRNPPPAVPSGDPLRGRQALEEYGCGSCHTIPGVASANATVGPPLTDWADRRYIAGALANEPENLILWIRFPQEVEPGTAMPDMGVEEEDARDMSAYLYTLKRDRGSRLWPFSTGNR